MAGDKAQGETKGGVSRGLGELLPTGGPCGPKEKKLDPYVKARCGTKNPVTCSSKPAKGGGSTPTWTPEQGNEIVVHRHRTDEVRCNGKQQRTLEHGTLRSNNVVHGFSMPLYIVHLQGVMLLEVWDKDKFSRDEFIGGTHSRASATCGFWLTQRGDERAGGCVKVEKYIDSPDEEFTETVMLYEKGVKRLEGETEHQGQGANTGIVSRPAIRA